MDTQHELDRVNAEIDQCRAALRSPTVGLFSSRKLYRRLESLYREQERLTIDLACDHVLKDTSDNEKALSTRPTIYR